jgi:type I restriction enzyme S subunit
MREMKESGIPWIGKIPQDWNIVRLKYLGTFGKGLSITKADLIHSGTPVISYGQVHSKDNTGTSVKTSLIRYVSPKLLSTNRQALTFYNDFIFADTSEDYDGIGNCVFVNSKQNIFAGYHTIILTKLKFHNPKYLAYLFLCEDWRNQLRSQAFGIKVFSLTQKTLKNAKVFIPSESEQDLIVKYLDAKCLEIDALQQDLQAEIETLQAYKKSLITRAVTQGLDPHAEMKDSRVEWCPRIPNHWNPINPKILFQLRNERAKRGQRQLTASQKYGIIYQDEFMEKESQKVVTVAKDFSILKQVMPNDFVISMRSFQGGLEYSTLCGSISSAYVMLIPNEKKVYPPFYRYFFKSSKYINAIQSTSNLVRDGQAMRYSNFAQVYLFDIPLSEQKEIADYLNDKIPQIEMIINLRRKQQETLEQYKKSLIYEVVTGKKEVPVHE